MAPIARRSTSNGFAEVIDLDVRSRRLAVLDRALAGFKVVHAVIGDLRWPVPGSHAEDAFHSVQRGLDEVIDVPDLVRVGRDRGPEDAP